MSVTSTLFKYDYQFKTFSKSFCGVVQFLLKTDETKTKTFQGYQCQDLISTSTGFIKVRETSLTFRTISIYDKDVLVNLYSSLNSNQSEMYCCSYCNVIVWIKIHCHKVCKRFLCSVYQDGLKTSWGRFGQKRYGNTQGLNYHVSPQFSLFRQTNIPTLVTSIQLVSLLKVTKTFYKRLKKRCVILYIVIKGRLHENELKTLEILIKTVLWSFIRDFRTPYLIRRWTL